MINTTEEDVIILTHEILNLVARLDLVDHKVIDGVLKRVSSAGMPPTLTNMIRDVIENIAAGGLDP